MRRFRSRRSVHAPMSKPNSRCGRPNIAKPIPSDTADPVSLNTRSGSANCVIELPKLEMVSPVQNFQKSARIPAQTTGSRTHTSVVPDTLDRYLEQHGDRFVSELRELCAIPSEATDPAALDAAAGWCRERLVSAGADSHELRVVGETGTGERTLICVQHYDVQPAVRLDLWRTPPYDPAVRDGAVFARGVDDNKGHLLLRIQALEVYRAVQGDLPIRLRFLIEGEEESGSPSLGRLLALDPTLTDGDGALKEGDRKSTRRNSSHVK